MVALTERLRVRGRVRVPGDKSISHRALIVSALSHGTSTVSGLLESADVRSTARALAALGVSIERGGGEVRVTGLPVESGRTLDCGNSGTTVRLLSGVVAGVGLQATFTGDASLSRRPMRRVAAPLAGMGARVDPAAHGGLPMMVQGGKLRDLDWTADVASAQVKSAVLLAGCAASVGIRYKEPVLSRDHTERALAWRGAIVHREGTAVILEPTTELAAARVDVPGDPSSAAFLAGLAALAGEGDLSIQGVCLNPTRIAAFEVLRRMGAQVEYEEPRDESGEPVGDVRIRSGGLHGVTIGAAEIPALVDEIPLLACVAAVCEGETVITGAAELRVKESDRIASVVAGLRSIGVDAEELNDGLRVRGTARPLRGSIVTHGDHRIAMAFGVLSALPRSDIVMDDPACVDVSYPTFWRDVAHVRK